MLNPSEEANELLKEMIRELKDLKDAVEKESKPAEAEKSAALLKTADSGKQKMAGLEIKSGDESGPDDKKDKAAVFSKLATVATALSAAAVPLVNALSPGMVKDIDRDFDYTHNDPYKATVGFARNAASSGFMLEQRDIIDVYQQYQKVGQRQLKSLRDVEDSGIMRDSLVAANVEKLFGVDMGDKVRNLERKAQAWWNNDASLYNQRREISENITNAKFEAAQKKYNKVNEAIMRNDKMNEE